MFVYPGQGRSMGWHGPRVVADRGRAFRRRFDAMRRRDSRGGRLVSVDVAPMEGVERRSIAPSPTLFAVAVALRQLWRSWGVRARCRRRPQHGRGGRRLERALTLRDAVTVICTRSRLLASRRAQGAMAVVELGPDAIEAALVGVGDRVGIAASNSPRSTVISGNRDAVDALLNAWERDGVHCRRIQVDVAAHSSQVDGLQPELERSLAALRPAQAVTQMISTVSGERVAGDELNARYWARNLRAPVRFSDVVHQLVAEGHRSFVELGPHPVLTSAVQDMLRGVNGVAVGALRRNEPERLSLLRCLGALYEGGANIRWDRVTGIEAPP